MLGSLFRKSPESIVADAEADANKLADPTVTAEVGRARLYQRHGYLIARAQASGIDVGDLILLLLQMFGPLIALLLNRFFDRWYAAQSDSE